jgi:hypothetical protein
VVRSDYEFEQQLKQLEQNEKHKKRFENSLVDPMPPQQSLESKIKLDFSTNARDHDPKFTEVSTVVFPHQYTDR